MFHIFLKTTRSMDLHDQVNNVLTIPQRAKKICENTID